MEPEPFQSFDFPATWQNIARRTYNRPPCECNRYRRIGPPSCHWYSSRIRRKFRHCSQADPGSSSAAPRHSLQRYLSGVWAWVCRWRWASRKVWRWQLLWELRSSWKWAWSVPAQWRRTLSTERREVERFLTG